MLSAARHMKILIGALIVILLALQYKLWIADDGYRNVRHLQQEIAAQKVENEKLRERNQALQAEVEDLKSGLAAIEELARNELGMIKEGETFFQVIRRSKATGKTPPPSAGGEP
jgi:cell division protein FtsB